MIPFPIPNKFYLIGGGIALVFLVGYALGNVHATQRALTEAMERRDEEMATVTAALIEQRREDARRVQEAMDRATEAEEAVHATLTAAMEDAETRRAAAEAQIARDRRLLRQDRETIEELRNANASLSEPIDLSRVLCGSGDTRRVLDEAATGPDHRPGAGTAEAGSASGAVAGASPAAEAPPLTCAQLIDGYLGIALDDAEIRARERSWREWYFKTFP